MSPILVIEKLYHAFPTRRNFSPVFNVDFGIEILLDLMPRRASKEKACHWKYLTTLRMVHKLQSDQSLTECNQRRKYPVTNWQVSICMGIGFSYLLSIRPELLRNESGRVSA